MARKTAESEDDFIRMQQEAIRRVRDMQERARHSLESAGVPLDDHEAVRPAAVPVNNPVKPPPPPAHDTHSSRPLTQSVWTAPAPAIHHPAAPPAPNPAQGTPSPGISHSGFTAAPPIAAAGHAREHSAIPPLLGNLLPAVHISLDSEQLLLLILIFLLYQDDSDKFLLLALAYVLFM